MALIYKGNGTEFINDPIVGHIPARDLTDGEVQEIADKWGLSLAETEGLLMKRKLYSLAPNEKPLRTSEEEKRPAKLHKPSFPKDSQSKSVSEQE